MASDHDAGGTGAFEAPHRTEPGLEAPVVSFGPIVDVLDPIVGVLGGVVKCSRQEVRDHTDPGMDAIGRICSDCRILIAR